MDGPSAAPNGIEIRNQLEEGGIKASIYRGAKLLAEIGNLAPAEKATFAFNDTIWISVLPQIEEGQIINAGFMSSIATGISLTGIASADIVMTGGGTGPVSTPFTFALENAVMA